MKHRPIPALSEKDVARLFAKIAVRGAEECWEWRAVCVRNGYGTLHIGGRSGSHYLAHRVAFALGHGADPGDLQVDHRCSNRRCCNPQHLRLATNKQNNEHRKGARKDSKSGVRGAFWSRRRRRWHVRVEHFRKCIHGGYFDRLEDAQAAAVALRNRLFTHNCEAA